MMRALLLSILFCSFYVHADPFDEVGTGELMLRGESGYDSAVRLQTSLSFDVTGMIAQVKVQQRFKNPSNDYIEGVYVFPLPEDAAVSALAMKVGNRIIKGSIKEKQQAKRIYEQAKAQGKKASLVAQARPNLFRNRIANIPPGGVVEVELTIVQPVVYDGGTFSLKFPLTITPRYIPGAPLRQKVSFTEGWGAPTPSVIDAHLITPWQGPRELHNLVITGQIKAGMRLGAYGSPSHPIQTEWDNDVLNFALAPGEPRFRDFVMKWQPKPHDQPTAAFFKETVGGEEFGILMVVPPEIDAHQEQLPREMTFVVDTSGSMGGTSLEQAKQSLLYGLKQLSPLDRFNIVEFSSSFTALFPSAVHANQANILEAQSFVNRLQARGGTEMMPALRFALGEQNSEQLRQIVFITDGAVGNEAELLSMIAEKLDRARLFTVAIGSAPNGYFMRRAAEFGRGSYTSIGDVHEVASSMASLFSKLSKPIARDIVVDWPEDWQVFPEAPGDLYSGEPLLVAIKQGRPVDALTVRGETAAQSWQQTLTLNTTSRGKGVATLWARSKLKFLLDQKHRGVSETTIRPEALKLALTHQILSPYTSFVAVEDFVTRPAGHDIKTRAVTNPVPDGQTLKVMMPQTHTGWWLWLLMGLSISLLSVFGIRRV